MKKFLFAFLFAFMLAGFASATDQPAPTRVFQGASSEAGWPALERQLETGGFIHDGVIDTAALAFIASQHGRAPAEVRENPETFLALNGLGPTITVAEFKRIGQGRGFYLGPLLATPMVATTAEAPAATPLPVATTTPPRAPVALVTPPESRGQDQSDERLRVQAERVDAINANLADKSRQIARLEQQLRTAQATGRQVTNVARELEAAKAEFARLQQALPEVVGAATQIAVLPVSQRLNALGAEVAGVQALPIVKYGDWLVYGAAALALALLGTIGVGFTNRRQAKQALDLATAAKAEVSRVNEASQALDEKVENAEERVTAIAEKVGLKVKDVVFDRRLLLADLKALPNEGTYRSEVHVILDDGCRTTYEVALKKLDEEYVTVEGVLYQTQSLRIENLPVRLKRAGFNGHLLKAINVVDKDGRSVLRAA